MIVACFVGRHSSEREKKTVFGVEEVVRAIFVDSLVHGIDRLVDGISSLVDGIASVLLKRPECKCLCVNYLQFGLRESFQRQCGRKIVIVNTVWTRLCTRHQQCVDN